MSNQPQFDPDLLAPDEQTATPAKPKRTWGIAAAGAVLALTGIAGAYFISQSGWKSDVRSAVAEEFDAFSQSEKDEACGGIALLGVDSPSELASIVVGFGGDDLDSLLEDVPAKGDLIEKIPAGTSSQEVLTVAFEQAFKECGV